MTSGSPASFRRAAAVILVAGFALAQIQPARGEEEKKGFFSKIFGGGKSEEKPAEKPAEVKPESKPKSTTSSKSKSTASKPKSEPAKKPAPKPVVAEKKTEEKPKEAPKATPKVEIKPAPAPQTASVNNVKNEAKPSASNPWHVIDLGGRDYITLESIRNFYNPLFGFSSLKTFGSVTSLESKLLVLRVTNGSNVMTLNSMRFILSFKVVSHQNHVLISRLDVVKLLDPVLRPSHIQGAELFDTVVIDAGHGGHDPGARGVYGYEKTYTLKLAQHLRSALQRLGFKVVLTRSTDVFLSLSERVAIANQIPKSVFISLHFNSSDNLASGIETWALTPKDAAATISRGGGYNTNGVTGNKQDSANIALASALHARVITSVKAIDRGIMRAQWSVLTGITRPAVLFEGGFVTNPKECLLIASDSYQKVLAASIADAVVNYRKALEPSFAQQR